MANVIFNDKTAKKKLEKIMHSKIKKEILKKIKQNKNKIIFVEIPLFFENSNYNFLLNKIVIYCSYELSLTRLMNRNNLTEFEAKLRLNSQLHIDKKIKFANYLIKNDGNLEDFKDNSLKLIQKLKEKHGIS
ncbi:dephospho-CoA kinase [Campylobacter sp. 2018MI27]|uniref:dephospho-CoA kinase n=1 Tax=Campylobacter sp. 2018MI27 TaxID=2836738 RepID=UPI001BDB1FB6|nr:dephospho-CoA kinase [Campylobacter sp. 2018MI27]